VGEYTLLGLIAQAPGGIHGYDLTRTLTDGTIGEIIRLEPGMLYHYLKKLDRRGYITSTRERQAGRPDRHLHALTPEGTAAFDAWLAEPVTATREMRLDFLLKLWFARKIDRDRALALVRGQRATLEGMIASLDRQRANVPAMSADDRFARKILELRLAQNRAAVAWLDELEHDL
jgi:DNA-binding PadR family transcriptional regulator